MATGIADLRTWVAGYDMTGDSNEGSLSINHEELDATVFGDVAHDRIAGLQDVESSLSGFWQAGSGTVDPAVFTALGGTLQAVTQSLTGAEGSVAYFYQAKSFQYEQFGEVGAITPFSLAMKGVRGNATLSVGAVRGRILKAKGTVSATGALGTGYQLGAVGASQYLYAAFHVFSAGTTITAVLESDDNSDFTSATTRATLGPLTTTGGTWITRVAGAITDDYYRLRVTAITGTFTVAGSAGIQ